MPRAFVCGRMPCKLVLLLSGLTVAGALTATTARARPGPCGRHGAQAADGGPCRDRKVGSAAREGRRGGREASDVAAREVGGKGTRREALPYAAWFVSARQARGQSGALGHASVLEVGQPTDEPPHDTSPDDVLEQAFTPAEADVASGSNVTVVPATQIAMVYVAFFGPLAGVWLGLHRLGALADYYSVMLPITLVVLLIGFDTANQSLSALTHAPMSITAVHALSLWLLSAVWSYAYERRQLASVDRRQLKYWVIVMLFFTGYQMMNHLVSYRCSLSERIIYLNLCPVVSLIVELSMMPISNRPKVSAASRFALFLMAVGAALFTIEKADFTKEGLLVATSFILVLVPYRLSQRWAMTCCVQDFPLGILASLDGFALFTPSAIVAAAPTSSGVPLGVVMHRLFSNPAALFLLCLTAATFIGIHVCGFLMMRVGTATSYMVFSNMANFILAAISIVLFKENVAESPVCVGGLLLSLVCGVWYSMEVRRKELEAEEMEKERLREKALQAEEPPQAGFAAAATPSTSASAASLLQNAKGG